MEGCGRSSEATAAAAPGVLFPMSFPTQGAQQPLRNPLPSPDEGGAGPGQGEQQEEAAGAHGGDGAAGGGRSEAGGPELRGRDAAAASRACFCRQSGPRHGSPASADGLKLQPAASREGGTGRARRRGRGRRLTAPPG